MSLLQQLGEREREHVKKKQVDEHGLQQSGQQSIAWPTQRRNGYGWK
jgi:hypothetical protein